MSPRHLLASLQAPFLKDKKGVRFSTIYLQKKRNLLVLDHSHQQIRKGNLLLDLQKLQKNPIFRISVDIRQNTNFVWAFTTSANIRKGNLLLDLQKFQKNPIFRILVDIRQNTNFVRAFTTSANALNVTPADSAHPFESPVAGKRTLHSQRE
ncbi:hypothetical protein Tco_0081469 [Tanacetum coccineum]